MVTSFTIWKALKLGNVPFFLDLLPRPWLAESSFHSVGLFPPGWNGSFHSWRFQVSLSVVFLAGRFTPIQEHLGAGATWSPRLLPYRAIASVMFRACSYHCCSCSSHPSPALFSSKTLALWVLTVSSAPDSKRRTPFGSFSLLGIHLRPHLLLP